MALGSILVSTKELTNSDVCDLFEEHEVLIATLGSRELTRQRCEAISEEIKLRAHGRGDHAVSISCLTLCVNSAGRICRHDQLDTLDEERIDELDVFYRSDVTSIESIRRGVEAVTVKWRRGRRPQTCSTTFDYVSTSELDDVED